MYTIAFDETSRVLTVRIRGFWSSGTLLAFLAEVTARAPALLQRGRFGVFVDGRDYQVQAGALAEGFGGLIVKATRLDIPICLLFGSTLMKMQATRAIGSAGAAIFLDETKARTWLRERLGAPLPPASTEAAVP